MNEEKKIGPTLSDIFRGLFFGTHSRVLYQELSKVADRGRGNDSPASEAVRRGLQRAAEEIHKTKQE